MAATNLQKNWKDVSHGSVDLTRVTNVSFDLGGQNQGFAGDNDIFNSVVVNMMNSPTASVTTGDPATLMAIAPGTDATLSATHIDAKGATGGDIIYVLTNAVAQGGQTSGGHAEFGTAAMQFMAYAPDGQTNPLSFTRNA